MMEQASTAGTQSYSTSYRYYVLFVLAMVYAFSYMDRNIVSILLGDLKAEFDLNDSQLGLLSGLSFALFYSTFAIPIARFADRANRTAIVSLAVFIWSIVTAACSAIGNFTQLLMCRVGVGIGEAGGLSPSHSILSDYFRPRERALILSLFSLGATLGAFAGVVLGGFIAENYGWRTAFLAAGLPGIALAFIVKLTVREPARGGMDDTPTGQAPAAATSSSFMESARDLYANRLYRLTVIAHVLATFTQFSVGAWLPELFLRNFEVSQSKVGTIVGFVFLCGGAGGIFVGGWLATRMAKARTARWDAYIPAIGVAVAVPIYVMALATTSGIYVVAVLFTLASFFAGWQHGPSVALVQNSVAPDQRATAASLNFFFSNLLGMGLGPLAVGALSDQLSVEFGPQSLNIAIGVMVFTSAVSAYFFYRTSQQIKT